MSLDATTALLDQLDTWRHFPNYQLERRADILFAHFLPGALEAFLDTPLLPELVPEFPIKRDLIWPEHPTSKSLKVDYLALSADHSTAWLIERKTDAGSRRDAQDHYLQRASDLGLATLLDGYLAILQHTSAHQKYHHLTRQLERMGLLQVPEELDEFLYPSPRPGLRAQLARIQTLTTPSETRIVYVQPTGGEPGSVLDFEGFADHLEGLGSAFAQRFAASLRRWRTPAGSQRPR